MFAAWKSGVVEIPIEDGDCRDGAHRILALLAYPNESETEKRTAFCDGAAAAYARWLRAVLAPEGRSDVKWAFGDVLRIPAQQSQNVLRMGMRRVGRRLAAARLIQLQLLLDGQAGLVRPQTKVNSGKPSMTAIIEHGLPNLARVIAVGDRDAKAAKNVQDRVVRESLPVAHLAHALLAYLQRKSLRDEATPPSALEHWAVVLLRDPCWIEQVVPAAMDARVPICLNSSEDDPVALFDAMMPVELVRREARAA